MPAELKIVDDREKMLVTIHLLTPEQVAARLN